MAAPNVNGRLHLTGVHQKPPASLEYASRLFPKLWMMYVINIQIFTNNKNGTIIERKLALNKVRS